MIRKWRETCVDWRIQRPALGCKSFCWADLARFSTFSADLGHLFFSVDAEPQPEPEPSESAHFSRSRSRWRLEHCSVYLMDLHVLPYVCIGYDSDERSRSRSGSHQSQYNLPGSGAGAAGTFYSSRSRSRDSSPEPEPEPSQIRPAPHA